MVIKSLCLDCCSNFLTERNDAPPWSGIFALGCGTLAIASVTRSADRLQRLRRRATVCGFYTLGCRTLAKPVLFWAAGPVTTASPPCYGVRFLHAWL